MFGTRLTAVLTLLLLADSGAGADVPLLPPGDKEPLLRLEAGGPTSFVTALAFSDDGQRLYAAGFDKVVRVWVRDAQSGRFTLDPVSYRVPIGPGLDGAINAIALSDDGTWLAVGGLGIVRGGAGFRKPGLVLEETAGLTMPMRLDRGTIYVFNTRTHAVRILRGHRGPVLAMTFAPTREGKPPLLLAAAREWDDEQKPAAYVGAVRVWNVASGAPVDLFWGLPDPAEDRPGLAAWHSGARPKQVLAAIAWEEWTEAGRPKDGILRLWDLDKGEFWKAAAGKANSTAAHVADSRTLIGGGFQDGGGQLNVWDIAGSDPRLTLAAQFALGKNAYPRALTTLRSQPDGAMDHAAVVLRVPDRTRGDRFVLRLVNLGERNGRGVSDPILLWQNEPRHESLPVVAAAPHGSFLAVGGNKDHEILLYRIADLLAGKAEPHQRLRSAGAVIHSVAFARRGKDMGLLLEEKGEPRGGRQAAGRAAALVFDLTKRTLKADKTGWQVAAPKLGAWRVQVPRDARGMTRTVTVSLGDQAPVRIDLKAAREITATALLPPMPPLRVPFLALAFLDDKGQPGLWLYNAVSGHKVRHLTGHTDPIHALAFADDGRLLASAAEDQTVCVWTLTNLDQIVGRLGLLPGVAVGQDLRVTRVDPASPYLNRLQLHAGDRIEGLVANNELRTFASALAFYEAIALARPKSLVTLRIRGKGDVGLVVGQGIDDRKPLFFLFVTRDRDQDARRWIGWSPNGNYDASDRQVERYLGWHFNTGRPEAPTSFALVNQYRKEYYREGILQHLVAHGNLRDALKAWEAEDFGKRLPRPKITAWIDEIGPDPKNLDTRGHVVLRQPRGTLKAAIDDFPLDRVASLTWQMDNGPAQGFAPSPDRERAADLSQVAWQRGVHKVRVVLRTQETEPRDYTQELTVRYQPPPPAVFYRPSQIAQAVGLFAGGVPAPPETVAELLQRQMNVQGAFRLQGRVYPAVFGEEVAVRILHRHASQDRAASIQPAGLSLDEPLTLQAGDNAIEVVATNKSALAGFGEFETSRLVMLVTVTGKKTQPPRIVLDQVVSESGPISIEAGRAVVVESPKVRLVGSIKAAGNLDQAEWARGEGGAKKALAGFQAGKAPDMPIAEDLTLEPGLQEIYIRARTAGSDLARAVVILDYRPPLPRLEMTEPAQGLTLYQGTDAAEVRVAGRLLPLPGSRVDDVVVLVNGAPMNQRPTLDQQAQTLNARVPLTPGTNRIQIQLGNKGKVARTSDPVQVRFLRPPHDLRFEEPRLGDTALTNLVATVRSPLPLLRESLAAEINGREITAVDIVPTAQGNKESRWTLHFKDVPLEIGRNEVRCWVSNSEARCLHPGTLQFVYNPPRPPTPPEVVIDKPAMDANLTDPTTAVEFSIKSAGPLKRVELVREGRRPIRRPFAVGDQKPDARGYYRFQTELTLEPGENPLRVYAVNAGGERHAAVVVNYLHLPVRLFVTNLSPKGRPDLRIVPTPLAEGRLRIPPVDYGRLLLQGHVRWDKQDEQLKKVERVRIYVNGFQQSVDLDAVAPDGRTRPFKAEIFLNRTEDNYVELDLPDLKQECGNCRTFTLVCRKPEKAQRLFLLVVGVGEADVKGLQERACQALHASAQHGQLVSPAFSEMVVIPLVGYVRPENIRYQLYSIKRTIDLSARAGSSNDVWMVYYQGGEAVTADGHFFLTSLSAHNPDYQDSAVSCDTLANVFAETLGAKVLLLDVARPTARPPSAADAPKDKVARWTDFDSYAGVIRYAQLETPPPRHTARLLADLREAIASANRLKEVTDYVTTNFMQLDKSTWIYRRAPNLTYSEYLPPGLAGLVVSGK
jgi:WD40 repeat protein